MSVGHAEEETTEPVGDPQVGDYVLITIGGVEVLSTYHPSIDFVPSKTLFQP